MNQFSVESTCRKGDADLLGGDSALAPYAVARISAKRTAEDRVITVDGRIVWTGSTSDLDSMAEAAARAPQSALDALSTGAAAECPAVREAMLTALLGFRIASAEERAANDGESAETRMRDVFLLPTEDGLKRQPHLYIPMSDPFFDAHADAFERLVELGLLGRIVWSEKGGESPEIVRYFTRLNVPLVAGYRYDMQSPISGPTHRVWRRIRFYMEMGFRRFLPEELREKMGGKPAPEA